MKFLVMLLLWVNLYRNYEVFGQSSGDLRLTSSNSSGQGRLEMFYQSIWTPFTIDGFDMHDADLACKKLGYKYASRYAIVGTFGYDEASTTNSISTVRCSSSVYSFSVYSFSLCKFSTTNSLHSHSSDIGLQCTDNVTSIRLVSSNGDTSEVLSGRLEILINDTWGTVCDDGFSVSQAAMACNQLGFISFNTYSNAEKLNWTTSDLNNTPIWLDDWVYCYYRLDFTTPDLRNCSRAVGVHNCLHSEDVILTCNSGTATEFKIATRTATEFKIATRTTTEFKFTTRSPRVSVTVSGTVGLIVGMLLLCSVLCLGGMLCVVAAGVIYRRKKISKTSATQSQPQVTSNFRSHHLSELASEKEHTFSPSVSAIPHKDSHVQTSNCTWPNGESSATEMDTQDNINDSNNI